jgi:hypothetical protein
MPSRLCGQGAVAMIADENLFTGEIPELTDSKDTIINLIKFCIEKAIPPFKTVMERQYRNVSLNEDKLTQIFVHQIEPQMKKHCKFLAVGKQYYDTFFRTKGVSDFYFHISEEGIDHVPIYVIEAKRLPAPDNIKYREKEYVVGGKNNGGIERYKTKKHGKWLSKSGMIGFVEQDSFQDWLDRINGWIVELSGTNVCWHDNEILAMEQIHVAYCCLSSVAHRRSKNGDMNLSHWWISLC